MLKRCLLEARLFFIALQFFTRIPIPNWVGFQAEWLQQCIRYFPLVGGLVGVFGALAMAAASLFWPPMVAVLLSMASTIWLTGGFHEDGWADTCDGLGGAVSKDRALTIMKDSRLGSYGALGLIVLLALKAAVLSALLTPWTTELFDLTSSHVHQVLLVWTGLGVIWAHTISRWIPVLITWALPYGGDADHAKAKPLALQAGWGQCLVGALLAILVAAIMVFAMAVNAWPVATLWRCLSISTLAAIVTGLWCIRWFRRRLGGFTGDTLGASQQLSEVACLLAWLAIVHPNSWVRWS